MDGRNFNMSNKYSADNCTVYERALFIHFNTGSVQFFARTGFQPSVLTLSRERSFDVQILRSSEDLIVAQPQCIKRLRKLLNDEFSDIGRTAGMLSRPEEITAANVYLALSAGSSEQFIGRVVLVKQNETSASEFQVYNIDTGEFLTVQRDCLYETPRCMRDVPQLVFLAKVLEGTFVVNIGQMVKCRIRSAVDDYPPYVVCEFFGDANSPRNNIGRFAATNGCAGVMNLVATQTVPTEKKTAADSSGRNRREEMTRAELLRPPKSRDVTEESGSTGDINPNSAQTVSIEKKTVATSAEQYRQEKATWAECLRALKIQDGNEGRCGMEDVNPVQTVSTEKITVAGSPGQDCCDVTALAEASYPPRIPEVNQEEYPSHCLQKSVDVKTSFPAFQYTAPYHLDVRVIRKVAYDVYSVVNIEEYIKIMEKMVKPKRRLLTPFSNNVHEVACIACVTKVPVIGVPPSPFRSYRAVAIWIGAVNGMCKINLVDLDQEIIGSMNTLFDLNEQPAELHTFQVAAFKLNVVSVLPVRKGVKTVKLENGQTYNVTLFEDNGMDHKGAVVVPFATWTTSNTSGSTAQQPNIESGTRVGEGTRHTEQPMINIEDLLGREAPKNIADQLRASCGDPSNWTSVQLQCDYLSRLVDMLTMNAFYANQMQQAFMNQFLSAPPPDGNNAQSVVPPARDAYGLWKLGIPANPAVNDHTGQKSHDTPNTLLSASGLANSPPPFAPYPFGYRPLVPNLVTPNLLTPNCLPALLQQTGGTTLGTNSMRPGDGNTTASPPMGFNFQPPPLPDFPDKPDIPVAGKTDFVNKETLVMNRGRNDGREPMPRAMKDNTMLAGENKEASAGSRKKDTNLAPRCRRHWKNRKAAWPAPTCRICNRDGHFPGSCPEVANKTFDTKTEENTKPAMISEKPLQPHFPTQLNETYAAVVSGKRTRKEPATTNDGPTEEKQQLSTKRRHDSTNSEPSVVDSDGMPC